jgi:SAM-dependent methyltransferase
MASQNFNWYKRLRRLGGKVVRWVKFVGWTHYCPLCQRSARRFIPIVDYPGQPTIDKYRIIAMGKNPRYRCPWCNSSDKERLVYSYLTTQTDIFATNRPLRVLHVAPERNTKNKLQARPNVSYVAGDKFEGAEKYTPEHYGGAVYLDITDLSRFKDSEFDLVICNHVLEHVPTDLVAMRELYRVLKTDGQAILQVPVSRDIVQSIEDGSATTPEQRTQMFGQADHVRIYAENDYLARLKHAGFVVIVWTAQELAGERALYLGINERESVFVADKEHA